MFVNDFFGDMLICICNVLMCNKCNVFMLVLVFCCCVFDVFKSEGYICDYVEVDYVSGMKEFEIEFKYFEGDFVIFEIKCILKFGCCVYLGVKDLLFV